jgi:DNA-binding CsgD family transcriptional regulator
VPAREIRVFAEADAELSMQTGYRDGRRWTGQEAQKRGESEHHRPVRVLISNFRFGEVSMTDIKDLRNQTLIDPPVRGAKAQFTESCTADPALRKTGLPFVSEMPWGAHLCIFHETKEDLLDTLASYLDAGLESNEFCLWAVSDPFTRQDARKYLRRAVPKFDKHLSAGQIEILDCHEWLKGDQFDLRRIMQGWSEKLTSALAKGYDGMRVSGNTFWVGTSQWKEFCAYEHELDASLAGWKMIVLCTYPIRASRAVDVLDVARAHQFSMARRNGEWEFLETPELKRAKQEINKLNNALDILSKPFSGHQSLTPRERMVLAQIVRGISSKEAARALGIAPRTVEFHRANIMQKLGARNTVDLVRKVLAA